MKGWKQAHAGASQRTKATSHSLQEGRKQSFETPAKMAGSWGEEHTAGGLYCFSDRRGLTTGPRCGFWVTRWRLGDCADRNYIQPLLSSSILLSVSIFLFRISSTLLRLLTLTFYFTYLILQNKKKYSRCAVHRDFKVTTSKIILLPA